MKISILIVTVISSILVISIGNVLWVEYGMVCNGAVVKHLQKYSNLFSDGTTYITYAIHEVGYPFGVHSYNVKQCVDSVLEKKHSKPDTGNAMLPIEIDTEIHDIYKNKSEVVAFYATYDDVQFSVTDNKISYFAGSNDGFLARMNLYFDQNHSITDMDFHCYFEKTHQYEFPSEDIASKIEKYTCK